MAEQPAAASGSAAPVNLDVRDMAELAQSRRWHCLILAPMKAGEEAQGLMILQPGPLPDDGMTISLRLKTTD